MMPHEMPHSMTGPEVRDANDVHDEHVAGWTAAIAAAVGAVNAQQAAAGAWLDGGLPAAIVGQPTQLEAAPAVIVEQANEPSEPVGL
jgi:hypothetical protein